VITLKINMKKALHCRAFFLSFFVEGNQIWNLTFHVLNLTKKARFTIILLKLKKFRLRQNVIKEDKVH